MSIFTVNITTGNEEDAARRVLHLEGTPFEQGKQHGEQVGELIRRNLEAVRSQHDGKDATLLEEAYRKTAAYVQRTRPDTWAEYEGLAEGSGLSLKDILMLNLKVANVLDWLRTDCSQFAKVVAPGSPEQRTLIAKTRDQKGGATEHVVLLRTYPDGYESLEIHKAGILSYAGSVMNSAGLAAGTSGVWSARTPFATERLGAAHVGSELHELLRGANSLEELPVRLAATPRLTGINNLVAERGRVGALEVTAAETQFHDAGSGTVVRTNHYETDRFQAISPQRQEYESTFHRSERIAVLLEQADTPQGFWQISQDHAGYPQDSVCRHRRQDGSGVFTTYVSVFEVETHTAWIGFGQSCQLDFPGQ